MRSCWSGLSHKRLDPEVSHVAHLTRLCEARKWRCPHADRTPGRSLSKHPLQDPGTARSLETLAARAGGPSDLSWRSFEL